MYFNESFFEQASAIKCIGDTDNTATLNSDWYKFTDKKVSKIAVLLFLQGNAAVNKNNIIFRKRKGDGGQNNPFTPKTDVFYKYGTNAKRKTATGSNVDMSADVVGNTDVIVSFDVRPENLGVDQFDQFSFSISAAGHARSVWGFFIEYTTDNPVAQTP